MGSEQAHTYTLCIHVCKELTIQDTAHEDMLCC